MLLSHPSPFSALSPPAIFSLSVSSKHAALLTILANFFHDDQSWRSSGTGLQALDFLGKLTGMNSKSSLGSLGSVQERFEGSLGSTSAQNDSSGGGGGAARRPQGGSESHVWTMSLLKSTNTFFGRHIAMLRPDYLSFRSWEVEVCTQTQMQSRCLDGHAATRTTAPPLVWRVVSLDLDSRAASSSSLPARKHPIRSESDVPNPRFLGAPRRRIFGAFGGGRTGSSSS